MPSRFRISAMTCITCIGRSSHLIESCPVLRGTGEQRTAWCCRAAVSLPAASTNDPARIGAAAIAFRLVTNFYAWPDIAGILQEAGAAVGAGRFCVRRRRRLRRAGAADKNGTRRNQKKSQSIHWASMASAVAICQGGPRGDRGAVPRSSLSCNGAGQGVRRGKDDRHSRGEARGPRNTFGRKRPRPAGYAGCSTWMTRLAIMSRVPAA